MSRKLVIAALTAMLVLVVAVSVALAIVTFDPSTGAGFVGKGDVQLAFGWNNATLQQNANAIGFSYNYGQIAYQDCEATIGRFTISATLRRIQLVHDVIQYDARTHKQVDGFVLQGYGTITVFGATPVCPDFATPIGDLYYSDPILPQLDVTYNGSFAKIWQPTP